MIRLDKYFKEHKEEQKIIAKVFYKTHCYNYATKTTEYDYSKDKSVYKYQLIEDFFVFEDLYLLKEKDSYLIFSITDNIYKNDNRIYNKTREKLQNVDKVILLESIYSFTRNKKLATKNIQRLKKIAESMNVEILVDTYTQELVHLSLKHNLNIMKEDSLKVLD